MIKIIRRGEYRLFQTTKQTKILVLDNTDTFAWIATGEKIGEILVTTHKIFPEDCTLAIGNFRLYDIQNEENFTDQVHLELYIGEGKWQGYILPAGLPTDRKKRHKIIPTKEIITMQRINEHQGAAWL